MIYPSSTDPDFFARLNKKLDDLREPLVGLSKPPIDWSKAQEMGDEIDEVLDCLKDRYNSSLGSGTTGYGQAHIAYNRLRDHLFQARDALHEAGGSISGDVGEKIRLQLAYAQDNLNELEQQLLTIKSQGDLGDYDDLEQPWYVPELPQVHHIDSQELDRLRSQVEVLLLTVNDREFSAVIAHARTWCDNTSIPIASHENETFFFCYYGCYKSAILQINKGSIGRGAAKDAVFSAYEYLRPKAIIMVGVAFGKDRNKQKIADVLVASSVIPYDPQRTGQTAIPRGESIISDTTLLNRFKTAQHTWRFTRPDGERCKIHIGEMLSGEELVDNPRRKAELFHLFPNAIGGDMEGAGLSATAVYKKVPWILVKAISDWGDGTKKTTHDHQPLAAAAAADLVFHVLSAPTALSGLSKP